MASKEMITNGILSAVLLSTAGCGGAEGPKEYSGVSSCSYNETNVEPTYIPGQQGYSELSDPNVIAEYQRSLGGDWGVGMLVCTLEVEENWDGSSEKTKQVLNQEAVKLAREMQEKNS